MSSEKQRNAIIKSTALLVAFIFGLYVYHRVTTSNLVEEMLSVFDDTGAKYSNKIEFKEDLKIKYKKEFAGFWTFTSDSGANPRIDDRIELKDNGIVWEVNQIFYTLPSGKKDTIMNVVFGYSNPFSPADYDSTHIVSNFIQVRQVWIKDNDTCYGESNVGGVWDMIMVDGLLQKNGRVYNSYGTENLDKFFPAQNLINLTDKIDMKPCKKGEGRLAFARRKLNEDLNSWGVANRDSLGIIALVNEYFVPFCLIELPLDDMGGGIEVGYTKVGLNFTVLTDGTVSNSEMQSRDMRSEALRKLAASEVAKWQFGPTGKLDQKINYSNDIILKPILF